MPLRQDDRLKGAANSRVKRRLKKEERRQRAKELFYDAGMSKGEIAKILRVSYRTIMSDFRAIESEIESVERNAKQ